MAYKVIPQLEFDQAVQKIIACGLARTPAENIALALWQASIDLGLNFRDLIYRATATGQLDVDQAVLNHINQNVPATVRYNKKVAVDQAPVVNRELRYS